MKIIFLIIAFVSSTGLLEAQTALPGSFMGYQSPYFAGNSRLLAEDASNKKWFLSKYASVSAGYSFFRGGSFSYIAAPIGLQLNRKLNNNLYAFAGLSVAPTYINFNQPVPVSGMNKGFYSNSMFGSNNLNMYQRAELGLMYMNDEKTFSISGSISVQRSSFPVYPYQQMQTKQPPATRANY